MNTMRCGVLLAAMLGSVGWGNGLGRAEAAEPFARCPAEAFLVQSNPAQLYGVNLATGFNQDLATDMGTSGKVNAIAFNFQDGYLYAWSHSHGTLARIGSDYQVEPLPMGDIDYGGSFYVGDISLSDNAHYLYHPNGGLYRVPLDPAQADYLQPQTLLAAGSLSIAIFDFAFHPDDGDLYSVDRQGTLWRISPQTLGATALGQVGQSGTFGAVYFDVTGTLYISRNNDGQIFRLDPKAVEPTAEFFAQGPSSSNNDGARCALAPVVDPASQTIDFGDAPDSHGTTLASNGARHQLVAGGPRLGQWVDGEAEAHAFPASDDDADPGTDEDGVAFITAARNGEPLLLSVTTTPGAYLNGWIDFDGDGQFQADEQVISDRASADGSENLLVTVPEQAADQWVWSRFRLSSVAGLGPTGGAPDGEVEDHPLRISRVPIQIHHYPSSSGQATVAFEDNWPAEGDYDFNDVVVRFQTRLESNEQGQALSLMLTGQVVASGAGFHNGLAWRLPGVPVSYLQTHGVWLEINGELQPGVVLESGHDEVVARLSDDLKPWLHPASGCDFYRTVSDCAGSGEFHFRLYLPFAAGIASTKLPDAPFDPFLFAGPGSRSPWFSDNPGRGLEIHLKNQAPTALADSSLWGQHQDASQPGTGRYYQAAKGQPWVILVPDRWRYPKERVDIGQAYPGFADFAQSLGQQGSDWFLNRNAQVQHLYPE